MLFFMPALCISQGVGHTIINQTFGESLANVGPQLPVGITSYTYSNDSCPAPGSYIITNTLFRCPATRIGRSLDNTPSSNNGYMMVFSPPGDREMLLYNDTIKQALCPNTSYQFSAYLLNASIPKNCNLGNPSLPRFKLSVETINGIELQSANTGDLPYAYDLVRTPQFTFYAVSFVTPPAVGELIFKIKSLEYGAAACNFYVAVDDIQFAAIGPKASIGFDDAVGAEIVKRTCYTENKSITLTGEVGAYYASRALQWQQSNDRGETWRDIFGATAEKYTQTFSIADTFLFRLTAAEAGSIGNVNCRIASNILTVEVNGIPKGFKVTSNSPVCVGVDVVFNSHAGEGLYYDWTGPNGFHDDVFYPSVNHTQLKDSGMYYVTVTSVGGCVFKDSTYVKVYGIGAVTAGKDTGICLGNSIQLHATKGAKIIWSPGSTLSDSTIADPIAAPLKTTIYSLRVIDISECVSTASVKIELLNKVVVKAKFSGPGILCRPNDTATFYNASEGDLANWNWNFGNGQTSTLKDPPVINFFTQNDVNFYNTRLIVKDSAGCTDTAWHTIKVADNCYIAVPSAFTPNGDGLNDYLYPVNAYKATDLTFRIFNRNGQVVFQTKEWTNKWDGRVKGVLEPTGVYVWTLEYKDASSKRISLKGTTALIR